MTPAQWSLFIFICGTYFQAWVFCFRPQWYETLAPGLFDQPPLWIGFRMLGLNEVGLMSMYAAACMLNYRPFMWMTVVMRATTIPFTLWITLGLGAPVTVWGGVAQDMLFLTWTAKALMDEAQSPPPSSKKKNNQHQTVLTYVVRGLVCCAGLFEFIMAINMMLFPTSVMLGNPIVHPLSMGGTYLATRSLGYMSSLMGMYQIGIGVLGSPLIMDLSVGFCHLWFWGATTMLNRVLISNAGERVLNPHVMHAVFGILVTVATLTEAWGRGTLVSSSRKSQ